MAGVPDVMTPFYVLDPAWVWEPLAPEPLTARLVLGTDRRFQYQCPVPECGRVSRVKSTMRAHFRTHTKERPYACFIPGCDRRFPYLSGFTAVRCTALLAFLMSFST
jgi:hypothetical protein